MRRTRARLTSSSGPVRVAAHQLVAVVVAERGQRHHPHRRRHGHLGRHGTAGQQDDIEPVGQGVGQRQRPDEVAHADGVLAVEQQPGPGHDASLPAAAA